MYQAGKVIYEIYRAPSNKINASYQQSIAACKTSNHCLLSLSSGLVLVFGRMAQLAIPPLAATYGKSY